ncbi:hypothetical protein GEMRC1_004468 [Eukaryota sp. GEM-RC1]
MIESILEKHPLKGTYTKQLLLQKDKLILFDAFIDHKAFALLVVDPKDTQSFPIFLEYHNFYVPSLQICHLYPNLLHTVYVHPPTLPFLLNGAPLFTKGVLNADDLPATLPLNSPLQIKFPGSSQAVAVGLLKKRLPLTSIEGIFMDIIFCLGDNICKIFHYSPALAEPEEPSTIPTEDGEEKEVDNVEETPEEETEFNDDFKISALCFCLLEVEKQKLFPLLVSAFVGNHYKRVLPECFHFKKVSNQLNQLAESKMIVLSNNNGVITIESVEKSSFLKHHVLF